MQFQKNVIEFRLKSMTSGGRWMHESTASLDPLILSFFLSLGFQKVHDILI